MCKGFPGKLIERSVISHTNNIEIKYLIEFEYEKFIDKKYGVDSRLETNWARIYFSLICDQCNKVSKLSTQENRVRPHKFACKRGKQLYEELNGPFNYHIKEKN
jgi:hypothetical protein